MSKLGFVRLESGRRPRGRPGKRRLLVVDLGGDVRLCFGDLIDPRMVHAAFEAAKQLSRRPC
jgi:hypothetical protein